MKIKKTTLFLVIIFISLNVLAQNETYSVRTARFNSKNSDEFSPVYYRDGLVFCSNRNWNLFRNYQNSDNKGLLKINFVDTVTWKVSLFSRSLSTRYNDGPASFSKNFDTIYFSRNLKVDGALEQEISPRNKLGIFTAILEENDWIKVLDVRFNNEYYNITTPYISPDGKRLFFASDNPSGMGGTDLYYCNWTGDYWDEPVNLGKDINTTGNESYPFVNSEGGLFFSSDGQAGLGGKDIFYTKEKNGKWLPPVHLDPPVNSKYDDFALITDSVMGKGFFSSRRNSSVDIYEFKTNINQLFYCDKQRVNQYCFKFNDDGNIIIDNRYVQLVWNFGDGWTLTGQNVEHCYNGPGKYEVKLDVTDKKTGRIFFSKLSFNLDLKDVEQPVINSPLSAMVGQPVNFDGLSSNFPGSEILNYTWYFGDDTRSKGDKPTHVFREKGEYNVRLGLMVRNTKSGVIRQACVVKPVTIFTDKSEKTAYDNKPAEPVPVVNIFEYDHAITSNLYSAEKLQNQDVVYRVEIARSKRRLSTDEEIFKKVPDKYSIKETFIPDERIYSYTVNEEMNLMETYPCFTEISNAGYSDSRVIMHQLTDQATRELNNLKRIFGTSTDVFFNSNSSSLSSAGTQFLDLILGYLSKNQSLKLEISCHSDNQGSVAANQSLTQRRADAMMNYLVVNGISGQRLRAKGYGGTRPIAPNYQESDRKLNRRIDFLITENKP